MSIPHHRRERAAPIEDEDRDEDTLQSPWIGIALLAGSLFAAWVMAGCPAIVITGW